MIKNFRHLFPLLTLLFGLASCAGIKPDLKRLYEVSSGDRFQNPVVLIHGFLGSKLIVKDTEEELWPGRIRKLLFGNYQDLAFKIDSLTLDPVVEPCVAYSLFDEAFGVKFYSRLLETLEEAGNYQPGAQQGPGSRRYYVFLYDWRLDLVETAANLDAFIENIRSEFGDPNLKVDIVAHSMGALITRYYLKYGATDVLHGTEFRPTGEGAAKVRKVVLSGAPNLGTITALQMFMKGYEFGPLMVPPEIFITFPSMYQVLPHPDRDWMIDIDGRKLERNLYDIDTWKPYQWLVFNPGFQK
jgi:pimeloyl-ACP methyl ester carboxylesterase